MKFWKNFILIEKKNNLRNIILLILFSSISKCLFLSTLQNNNKSLKESKYISLQFKENNPSQSLKSNSAYSSNDFLNDNFINYLSIELNIGTPRQTINSFLNQENACFQFIEKNKWKNNNMNFINKIKTYTPKSSKTFLLNKNSKAIRAEDIFLFKKENNKNKNITNNINHIPFNLDTNFGEIDDETEFISELGINSKFSLDNSECPNFLKELKKNKLISDEIYSLKYKSNTQGNLIFGDYLYNIEEEKYKNNNFFIINEVENKNGINWDINFDKIYIYDKFLEGNNTLSNKANEGKVYLTFNTNVNLKIDQKIIIGTQEYKNMIDILLFNKFIESNICKIEIANYNSKKYYVYSCTAMLFATFESAFPDEEDDYYYQEPVYHYLHFPSLVFYSNKLNYYFELKYENLFLLKGERFYFMIVFEVEPKNKNQDWVIGEHFLKNHIFSFNVRSKKMLFYNEKFLNENFEENNEDEIIRKNIIKKEKSKNLIIFLIVLVGVCFSIFSFYLGIKIKERRKKKANELRDEYEYISEVESRKNSINNINKNISFNAKLNQEIELNIQF